MIRTRSLCLAAGSAALLGTLAPAATAAPTDRPEIDWHPCRAFSDETLKWMVSPEELAEFKQLWARTECGTIRVPLDYRKPHGKQITIAVTHLKATDRARQLGSLAINPGGPGGSGYLWPHWIVLAHRNGSGAALNQRYDLIGFDPRGVGYSTKHNCPCRPIRREKVTEQSAREAYTWMVKANRDCAARTRSS